MRYLAAYIMRGRMQAVVVATVSAILSLLLPPVSYISGAAIGLVTLRIGWLAGLQVIIGATLTSALLLLLLFGSVNSGMFLALLWIPLWVLAVGLRRTVRLEYSLLLAGLFGVVALCGLYLGYGDPTHWWKEVLTSLIVEALEGKPAQTDFVAMVAQIMSGVLVSAFISTLLLSLLLARWWQSLLYNPGGFRREFHALRLGRITAYSAAVLVVIAIIGDGVFATLVLNLLLVVATLFVLQGIAVVHGKMAGWQSAAGWLIVFYALLLFPFSAPYALLTMAVLGCIDNGFDFRGLLQREE